MLQFSVCHGIFVKSFLLLLGLAWLPMAAAQSDFDNFPDITFKVFSDFVQHQFGQDVSLATVLIVLFSLTSNSDLLALHARQQYSKTDKEIRQPLSGWLRALSDALWTRLEDQAATLLQKKETGSALVAKLDKLSKVLELDPYHRHGSMSAKLRPINEKDIAPVRVICPVTTECESAGCNSHAIHRYTRERDISSATLIEGAGRTTQVIVLAGQCSECKTIYHADHEYSVHDKMPMKYYLNSAKYLKVGQKVWVDRTFSKAVINGMYNFHASTSAFVEYWNMSFELSEMITRRHIWQAFIQESVRRIAEASGQVLELPASMGINKVTEQAYVKLGQNGIIECASGHACDECTHDYKTTADVIVEDPAAVVGVDENQNVPIYAGEEESDQNDESEDEDDNRMEVDSPSESSQTNDADVSEMNGSVQMIVMDGIVMGPKHCAFDDCTANLANYQTGIYCQEHEELYGHMCHLTNCTNPKLDDTLTCAQHQREWNSHVVRFGRTNLLGVQRLLRRSETEGLPWVPVSERVAQPHDQPASQRSEQQVKHHFVAPRFYCIETICAPCGVVIAWTKFAKSESPSNILDFLDAVYPDQSTRPDYICIDKACMLLRHAVASGRWNTWKETTRFIVDSYHYINHRTTDYLCRKYCNPAPLNGSAPNLVEVVEDKDGHPHFKRAYNTQACEQLNAWLGGFEAILKRMSAGNFNWFLHVMLFVHTQRVLEKIKRKMEKRNSIDSDNDSDSD